MPTLIDRFFKRSVEKAITNMFNEAFFSAVGSSARPYDPNQETYIYKGLLLNPVVSAVVQQRVNKALQIPFYVRKVDAEAKKTLDNFNKSTKNKETPIQRLKRKSLEKKAFSDTLEFPLIKPNPNQTWAEIIGLYEMFISTTGNFYLYILKGEITKEPLAVYVLPSHKMEIVVKQNASMLGLENPIDYYRLIDGNTAIKFTEDEIIHIKTPNPIYDQNGAHLYGASKLQAVLKNIQSMNIALDLNMDTMLNGGAFGFIHGMETPLDDTQAKSVNSMLLEMSESKTALGKIRGASAKLGFTQIRLSAKEMELFNYLKFDQKMICNALGWDDKLLNNDDGAKYDNIESAEQRVVVNTIIPSLKLFDEALTDRFLPLFKAYQNTTLIHDPSELPEMQIDLKSQMEWISLAVDKGVINRATAQEMLGLDIDPNQEMLEYTVSSDVLTLQEAVNSEFLLDEGR